MQFDLTEGRVSAQGASLYAKRNDPYDFAAKIEMLLDDESARRRMGALGRERVVKALSWKHEEPRLLAAYQAVFSEHAPRL